MRCAEQSRAATSGQEIRGEVFTAPAASLVVHYKKKKKKEEDNTTTLPPPNHPADNGHSSIVVGLYIV